MPTNLNGAFVGIGTVGGISEPEGTWGTAATRDLALRTTSWDVGQKTQNTIVEDLGSYDEGPTDATMTGRTVGGTWAVVGGYRGCGLGRLLRAILGAVTTTGSGPYAHAFDLAAQASFTLEGIRGNTGLSQIAPGAVCSKLVIDFPNQGRVSVSTDWIAKSATTRAAPSGFPTVSTAPVFMHGHEVGLLTFNAVTYRCSRLTVTINRHLEQVDEHGEVGAGDIVASNRAEVTIEAELNARVDTVYVAANAGTTGALSFTVTNGAASLAFSVAKAVVGAYSDPITSHGRISQKVTFSCMAVMGTTTMLTATLTNADAAHDDT
jgi:hypothetical protein